MPMTDTNPSLLDALVDPAACQARLAEFEAEVKSTTEAKREAEASAAELTHLLELIDGPLGKPLRELVLEVRKREAAVAKQESRIAGMERRLKRMREITS